jgi:hypothetical protein
MSVRKQTGGEMRRGQPAEAGATLRELGGLPKP